MNKQNHLYERDALDFGVNNQQTDFGIEGGIMQNYRKIRGQTIEEIMQSDFWDANK